MIPGLCGLAMSKKKRLMPHRTMMQGSSHEQAIWGSVRAPLSVSTSSCCRKGHQLPSGGNWCVRLISWRSRGERERGGGGGGAFKLHPAQPMRKNNGHELLHLKPYRTMHFATLCTIHIAVVDLLQECTGKESVPKKPPSAHIWRNDVKKPAPVLSVIMRVLRRSAGATIVLDTAPAMPPAMSRCRGCLGGVMHSLQRAQAAAMQRCSAIHLA